MTTPVPNTDQRTAGDIARKVQDLIKVYAPAWQELNSTTGQTGVSAALIGIFARFSEIIIQRLNQAPQKNFLAFLDLLGVSLLPPQPARVPLTFSLAAGSAVDGLVPTGTQVAAPPAEGEKGPVIFETERELTVTAAQLDALFVRDPEQDKQADVGSIIAAAAALGEHVFQGNQPIEHILYLGHSRLLGFPQIAGLRLLFTLEATGQDARELRWELADGAPWETPLTDQTQHLSKSGSIVFSGTQPIPESTVNALANRWVRGRLITPISISSAARLNMVRATQLPKMRQVLLEVGLERALSQGLLPEEGFTNAVPIDLGKDFFPFDETPKRNDALYLASAEGFSKDRAQGLAPTGATVRLDIQVANSHLLPTETSVRPSADLQLSWECWNGIIWKSVGISNAPTWLSLLELDPLPPTTTESSLVAQGTAQRGSALTTDARDPTGAVKSITIGEDGRFAAKVSLDSGINVLTFTATYKGRKSNAWAVIFEGAQKSVEVIASVPDQVVKTASAPLTINVIGAGASSITAVRVTNGRRPLPSPPPPIPLPLPGGSVSVALEEGRNDLLIEGLNQNNAVQAATSLTVSREANLPEPDATTGFMDGTHAFCQSGIVTLKLPDQVALTAVNGQENFWLRVRLIRGNYGKEASYKLKNPEAPEEGFILVLESFRPPSLSSVKIGYEQTLTGAPEVMLAYNNSTFVAVSNAVQPSGPALEPFIRAPEVRPTLYAGFTLPPERAVFPNRTISLYARVAELKYGERAIPLWPESSKRFGAPASVVSHKFTVTNAATVPARLTFSILGTQWQSALVPPLAIVLDAEQAEDVEVQVTIPAGTPLGTSDRGFLKLEISTKPRIEYTADFVTVAGAEAVPGERLHLVWEYWNGRQWSNLTVGDGTENFTRPGLIEFLAPPDITTRQEFGQPPRYWLRVRWAQGEYALAPRLRRMLLNTTMAAQTVTLRNEILGSSDGSSEQKFRTTRAPILLGPRLEVREPEMPSAAEQEIIAREEGADAITFIRDAAGSPKEIWVRWHEVPDLYGSGPRSRHYVLDHLTGEISSGDGLIGLIPPAGIGNIRLARYHVDGGQAGNKPAGAIVQLKTTVPYVDKVINTEAAAGGADAETLDSLLARAPRTIRHGSRVVTVEDYEDLAMLASPEVARGKCVPLRDLIEDALGQQPAVRGEVSVIIVPRSREAKPQPSLELLSRVQDYLEAHSVPTAHVSVVGPLYVRVDVKTEIALVSLEGASAVEQAVQQKLASFLHPLTGGLDGAGWDFGRKPHPSDVNALIEAVPGVDHLRSLIIDDTIEDQPGVSATGRFLVFSGTHTISLVFEED
jgi:predicted phage baseplate assembly protein